MDSKKEVTERVCLAAALTLLVKAGEIDEKQTNEAIEKEGYRGLLNILNTRYKEMHDN